MSIICPRCSSSDLIKNGSAGSGNPIYKCKGCGHRPTIALEASGNIADGYVIKGQSTLYDDAGNIKLRWEKTDRNAEQQSLMFKATIDALTEDLPRAQPVVLTEKTDSNLLNLYTITDYHVGMMAWHKEGGSNWNLKMAEDLLYKAFKSMIMRSPNADTCVISQLGDFLHFDGIAAVTPASGHVLDTDSRFTKIIKVAIRMLRTIIKLALKKHKKVHVICAEGNHDPASSKWLSNMLAVFYEDEPRITVDESALPYYSHQHGKVMLCFHHGHKKKKAGAPLLMAAMFPKVWGATDYRYYHCGHMHHKTVDEYSGIIVEQHQTLSARDSYASHGGWMAERSTCAITYHKQFGDIGRVIVRPEMLE